MKSYYVVNAENCQEYFGNASIYCVDGSMIFKLAEIRNVPVEQVLHHFHRATSEELKSYQALDSFIEPVDMLTLWNNAKATSDRETFVRHAAGDGMWKDLPGDVIPKERMVFLGEVWDSAHRGLQHLVSLIGMSVEDLCDAIAARPDDLDRWCEAPQLIPQAKLCLMIELLYPF